MTFCIMGIIGRNVLNCHEDYLKKNTDSVLQFKKKYCLNLK